jgi:geranylgeranylglycerol-phosphate geranylgeranyltransferase
VNKPKRPIPSGRIARSDVFMLSTALFLIGLGLAKHINDLCLAIALINTLILIVYAKYSKRMLLVSNFTISYLVASVFIYGAASAHTPNTPVNIENAWLLLILTLSAFLINFSREIIKDIEDIEGDKKAYSNTLPIRYGPDKARKAAILAAAITVLISLTPLMSDTPHFNKTIYAAFILVTNLLIIGSFTTHPTITQRLQVIAMILALTAFLLAAITPA